MHKEHAHEAAPAIKCFNLCITLAPNVKNNAVFEIVLRTLQATSIFMLLFPNSVGKEEPAIWELPEISHRCRNFVTSICRSTVLMCLDKGKTNLTWFCNRESLYYHFELPTSMNIFQNTIFISEQ